MDSNTQKNTLASAEEQSISPVTELTDDEKIDLAAVRIIEEYREAFLELAK